MKKQWIPYLFFLWLVSAATTATAQQDWHTTGNTVNTNDQEFIGTLNNMALNFKVANAQAGRIGPQGTVFLGSQAGNVGAANASIGIGLGALHGCGTLAFGNVGIGVFALSDNPLGNENTAVGQQALEHNWDGNGNTASGANAMSANYHGNENTATGFNSMRNNFSGNYNTGIGSYSLFSNSGGSNNTAVGSSALRFNTTGYENTGIGGWSLYSNTTGMGNTASGMYSLSSNTTGNYNTALGWNTLSYNTTGSENTACGAWSLYSNTTGAGNAALGEFSLNLNTTGARNTALGWNTLSNNLNGSDNCSAGSYSLYYNTGGYRNVALGNYSMANNTSGWANAAIGYQAAYNTTNGHGVVALGFKALLGNSLGNDNTALGNQAFLNGSQYNNSSAIGYLAQPQGSNEVVLGNSSIVRLRCNTATITTGSDKRIKDDIQENVPGLEFIEKLRPVTYHINVDRLNNILGVQDSSDATDKYDVQKKQMTGFIAQEVEQAAKTCKYDFSGVDRPDTEGGLYGLRYSEFVVPLVKATQELSAHNQTQNEVIETQKALIEALEKRLENLEAQVNGCCNLSEEKTEPFGQSQNLPQSNRLDQNAPNPFQDQTVIHYAVAEALPNTFVRVVTLEGDEIARYPIQDKGEGQISITANSLSEGLYLYELYINGERFASRKMVLTK